MSTIRDVAKYAGVSIGICIEKKGDKKQGF